MNKKEFFIHEIEMDTEAKNSFDYYGTSQEKFDYIIDLLLDKKIKEEKEYNKHIMGLIKSGEIDGGDILFGFAMQMSGVCHFIKQKRALDKIIKESLKELKTDFLDELEN